MAGQIKRVKDEDENTLLAKKVKTTCVFILDRKIQKRRLEILKKRCAEKALIIRESICEDVGFIVSDCDTAEEVINSCCLDIKTRNADVEIVSTQWLSDCIKSGCRVPVTHQHRIPHEQGTDVTEVEEQDVVAEFACQRVTPLKHHNHVFTDALEVLEKDASFRGSKDEDSRALAFRRASCTLKAYHKLITSVDEVNKLPDIGRHAISVIKDIIDYGFSREVEEIQSSEFFKKMKMFKNVYGVGPGIGARWIQQGVSSIRDVFLNPSISSGVNPRMAYGLAFYEDLNTPVERSEADWWHDLILKEAKAILDGVTVTLVGGFSRGKNQGHDIDLLLSHPDCGLEKDLLSRVLARLQSLGLVVFGNHEKNSFNDGVLKEGTKGVYLQSTLDHFEKWLGIIQVPSHLRGANETISLQSQDFNLDDVKGSDVLIDALGKSCTKRSWTARRVDLIVVPRNQYFYALLGWIGSRQFNRSMRNYASKKMNMKLTSHGLYDFAKGKALPADSEEEIFKHLNLEYIRPSDRNC